MESKAMVERMLNRKGSIVMDDYIEEPETIEATSARIRANVIEAMQPVLDLLNQAKTDHGLIVDFGIGRDANGLFSSPPQIRITKEF